MFDRRGSGYILPDGFAVVSAAFNRVADARQIARQSDEGQRLARHALHLYMGGTRETWELELRLSTTCPVDHCPRANGNTEVVDFLPELTAWSRSLTASQEAATALAEQTLGMQSPIWTSSSRQKMSENGWYR